MGALTDTISTLWPSSSDPSRPEIFGPDSAGLDTLYVDAAASAPGLGGISFHQYPECVPPADGCALANTSHACSSYGCRWSVTPQRCLWAGETPAAAASDLEYVLPPDCLAQVPRLAASLAPISHRCGDTAI